MSFSYDTTIATDLDKVRLLLGDVTQSSALFSDEEIQALLDSGGSPERVAADLARALGARFALKADKRIGDLSISYSKISSTYFELADRLDKQSSVETLGIYAGGIRVMDKKIDKLDTNKVQPRFRRDQFKIADSSVGGGDDDV